MANFFRYHLFILAVFFVFTQQNSYATTRCTVDYVQQEIASFDLVTNDNQNSKSHTIERHIAKSDGWLHDYLLSHAKIKGISTYDDLESAKAITKKALLANVEKIHHWLCIATDDEKNKTESDNKTSDNQASQKHQYYNKKSSQTLRISYRADNDIVIGHGFLRKDTQDNKDDKKNIIDAKDPPQAEQTKYSAYKTNKVVLVLRKNYIQSGKNQDIKVTQPKVEDSLGIKRLVDNVFGKTKTEQNKKMQSNDITNSEQPAATGAATKYHDDDNPNNPKFFLLTSYPVPN